MRTRRFLPLVSACVILANIPAGSITVRGQAPSPAALAGQVTSTEEGPMEGVVVTAKKIGSTIAVSVATDAQGRYRFPASRLEPGKYALSIRAAGYDIDGAAAAEVVASKTTAGDLRLTKTTNLAAQLSNSEWLISFPGTDQQKNTIRACTHCHTYELTARSRHNAAQWLSVLERMSKYTPESFPRHIQPMRKVTRAGGGELTMDAQAAQLENRKKQAEYLASLNLSAGPQWSYELKTLPRPKGDATKVIITEYDLPKVTRQPHDVIVDSQGMVWYAAFGEPLIGKMDPKTGKVVEYPTPVVKPDDVIGQLALEFDRDENLWIAMIFQGVIAKFDRKTEKFQVFSLPPELNKDYRELTFVSPQNSHVDGKVWVNDSGSYNQLRLDIATGKWEEFESNPLPRPNIYQMASDKQNNGWILMMGREDIGRIDAKTGKYTYFKTPTPRSAPRRGMMDENGIFWFGENRGNKIGAFDTKTETFQEWASPIPEFLPYDVTGDRNGEAWAVTEFADRVERLNPKTGVILDYLLPRKTNGRRAWVDNKTNPVTFWVGNNHGASIVKVEPLQ
jgi:streptogramin lyase